ncbi:MAG TPA: hypothetical protein VIG30_10560 [Ktedonobacterales bacterium]|jgi:hypothetical protein
MNQPTPQPAPTQPQPTPQAPGAPAPGSPYAGYPYYGYPYYPYPYAYPTAAAQQTKPPALPRSPSEGPGRPWAARVRNLVGAVIAVVLTVAAIAAAASAAANAQTAPSPASEGLRQVYSQPLVNDWTNWTLDHGCVLQYGGLLADAASDASSTDPAICKFVPSTQQDLLAQGFQATVVMAPSGDVPAQEQGGIVLGGGSATYVFDISQQGMFEFKASVGPSGAAVGSTIAWHADPSLANTITIDYSAANNLLQVYVNGQSILTQTVTLEQGDELGLFAPNGYQALFTSFTLSNAG